MGTRDERQRCQTISQHTQLTETVCSLKVCRLHTRTVCQADFTCHLEQINKSGSSHFSRKAQRRSTRASPCQRLRTLVGWAHKHCDALLNSSRPPSLQAVRGHNEMRGRGRIVHRRPSSCVDAVRSHLGHERRNTRRSVPSRRRAATRA